MEVQKIGFHFSIEKAIQINHIHIKLSSLMTKHILDSSLAPRGWRLVFCFLTKLISNFSMSCFNLSWEENQYSNPLNVLSNSLYKKLEQKENFCCNILTNNIASLRPSPTMLPKATPQQKQLVGMVFLHSNHSLLQLPILENY